MIGYFLWGTGVTAGILLTVVIVGLLISWADEWSDWWRWVLVGIAVSMIVGSWVTLGMWVDDQHPRQVTIYEPETQGDR